MGHERGYGAQNHIHKFSSLHVWEGTSQLESKQQF